MLRSPKHRSEHHRLGAARANRHLVRHHDYPHVGDHLVLLRVHDHGGLVQSPYRTNELDSEHLLHYYRASVALLGLLFTFAPGMPFGFPPENAAYRRAENILAIRPSDSLGGSCVGIKQRNALAARAPDTSISFVAQCISDCALRRS